MRTSPISISVNRLCQNLGGTVLQVFACLVLASSIHVAMGQDAPKLPTTKITNKLLGWDQSTVLCKFNKDLYDKINADPENPKEKEKIAAFVKEKVYAAIAVELASRPEKLVQLSAEEKAWAEFITHPDIDVTKLISLLEENSEPDVKNAIAKLIESVQKKERPNCVADPPVGLSVMERKNVFDALVSEIDSVSPKYAKEESAAFKSKILSDLIEMATEKIALELKKRTDPPADLSAKTIKSDFVFDIANLRTNLRKKLEGIEPPSVVTPPGQTVDPNVDPKLVRIMKFKARVYQFFRTASFVQSILAQFGVGGLEGHLAKSIIATLTDLIGEELRPEEKAEVMSWASDLSSELSTNRPQPQVINQQVQPQMPQLVTPQQPFIWGYGGRLPHQSHHKGRIYVVPAGSFSNPASGVFSPSSGIYFVR